MKKQYIRPTSQAFNIECQSIMKASDPSSISVDSGTEAGASTSFSNKGGWSSESWSSSEEE